MKICIYSVITNDYDYPKPVVLKNIPHFLFADNPNIDAPGWKIIEVEKTPDQRLQRKIKILGHEALGGYDTTIYVDASITLHTSFARIASRFGGGMIIGHHPNRNCVYAEGLAVKKLNKAPADLVNKQIAEYYENDFPYGFGMWSAGIIIRDNSEKIKQMCSLWWEKLSEHSHRDQLSLPWALWKTGIVPKTLKMSDFMHISKHKTKTVPKIYYSNPWSSDKNIGKANNDFIELLPDDSWVCIMDGDASWMLPSWGELVEKVVMENKDKYALIGCVTNRLGGLHQCYENRFDTECSSFTNYHNALSSWEKYGPLVEDTTGIAGLCMIFSKETWRKAGGFVENSRSADTSFNKSVLKLGGKIGLAKGLYMMHNYRIWSKEYSEAKTNYKHLVK